MDPAQGNSQAGKKGKTHKKNLSRDKDRNNRKHSEYAYEFRPYISILKTRLQEAKRKRELKKGLSNKQGHN